MGRFELGRFAEGLVDWKFYDATIDHVGKWRALAFFVFAAMDIITTMLCIFAGFSEKSWLYNLFGTGNWLVFFVWIVFVKVVVFIGMEMVVLWLEQGNRERKVDAPMALAFLYGVLFVMGFFASAGNLALLGSG